MAHADAACVGVAVTGSLYWSKSVQRAYDKRHAGQPNKVQLNDAVFALHATLVSFFTLAQVRTSMHTAPNPFPALLVAVRFPDVVVVVDAIFGIRNHSGPCVARHRATSCARGLGDCFPSISQFHGRAIRRPRAFISRRRTPPSHHITPYFKYDFPSRAVIAFSAAVRACQVGYFSLRW